MTASDLLRLAAIVFAAVSFIVVGDTAGKLLTAGGVHPIVVAWARFGIGALVLLPFSGLKLPELRDLLQWRVALRAVFVITGISCILTALKTEPIANVFGAFFVGPIVSYVLAIIFLGERPSKLRSLLLMIGFLGVLLVVKPGFGASVGMGFALAAGTFYGAYLMMTRTIAGAFRPRFLLLSQLLIGSVLLAPFGLTVGLPELTGGLALLFLVSALGSAAGNYLLVISSKKAEASLIAPLVYTQLVSATLSGILVFGDWPDLVSLIGLALIALSGGSALWDHQRRQRSAPI
ncbi:DMT family transporter [Cognatishimia sp. SS12]|uniref:DMT family transporter n=1 Tax=Cognatishimia sp. SS12 TaxID=2979465 RepID=UPI00232EAE72|nr:DMT family transporter [Cognatishimia sp. SS12]MDC0739480.1 DMT family transporter [Cognatishimia sp. SS12]